MRKSSYILALFIVVVFVIVGCNPKASTNNDKQLNIGFNPGPYIDQFKQGIEPQLIEKGYTITYTDFTDGIQPNLAVANGEIDANIFQHRIYMESINAEENIDLIGVVQVPTPPMGLYSTKHDTLENKQKAVVAMPSDPVNMTRALNILEDIGWVTLKDDIDPLRVTEQDIIANNYNIEIRPMDAAQGVRALDDADYVAIQGNYVISSGLELSSAFKQEESDSPYVNVVTVKEENKEQQFVKDIIDAYHAEQFQEAILSNEQFDGYLLPDYFAK